MRGTIALFVFLIATQVWAAQPPVVEPVEPGPSLPTPTAVPTESPTVVVPEKPEKFIGPLGPSWDSDEYLLWWLKPQSVPTLLIGGRGQSVPMVGQLNSKTLIGGDLKSQEHSGGRFIGGWSIDNDQNMGLELNYFFLGSRSYTQSFASNGAAGDLNLARPFISPIDGSNNSFPVATVGLSSGRFEMVASTRVQGAELNSFTHFWSGGQFRFDGIVGFRFLQVNEGMRIAQRTNESPEYIDSVPGIGVISVDREVLPPFLLRRVPFVDDIVDQIDGHNIFYGGQIGLRTDWQRGPVFIEAIGKIAFGQTNEVVKINGVQVVNNDGVPTSGHGGYYAQSTNSGRFTQSVFAVLPEMTVRTGWQHNNSRMFIGYNFLYLSKLARPGDQIDERLFPPSRTFGVAELRIATPYPAFNFKQSDFWAQGIVIGAEVRY